MTPLDAPSAVLAELLGSCGTGPTEAVPLDEALWRVLAEDLRSDVDVPAFANSAMDGYAVRAADVKEPGAELFVVGASMAGHPPSAAVREGETVRIMTGGVLPAGADAICMKEVVQVDADGARIRVQVAVPPGEHVRHPGEDVRAGDVVAHAGTALSPAQVGALASVGARTVCVVARPRVGVLSTGDELCDAGPLSPGMLFDSNRPALLAAAREAGCTPVDLGRAADEPVALTETLLAATSSCDAVLLSGGVSVGDADFVHAVLAELCGDSFRRRQLAMKPGKPFACGRLGADGPILFGLPGNPVSALVSFEVLVRPVLLKMAGRSTLQRPRVVGVADVPFDRHPDGKVHLVRVALHADADGVVSARPAGGQGSHHLRALAAADGLAILPDGDGVPRGAPLGVIVLRGDAPSGPFADVAVERAAPGRERRR